MFLTCRIRDFRVGSLGRSSVFTLLPLFPFSVFTCHHQTFTQTRIPRIYILKFLSIFPVFFIYFLWMTCSRTRRNGLGPQKGVLIETYLRVLDGKTGDILAKDVLKLLKTCLVCSQELIFNARITPPPKKWRFWTDNPLIRHLIGGLSVR